MVYKNSIKIFFSNFNLVWKMVLYFLISATICTGLFLLFLNPIVKLISGAGFFNQIGEAYADFLSSLNFAELIETVAFILRDGFDFFVKNLPSIWWNVLGAGLVVVFLNTLLLSLSNLAACKSLHFYIGSLTRQGFFTSFSESFGKNLKLQLTNYFVALPLNILYAYLFMLTLGLFGINWIINILAIFIIVIGLVILFAFKWTLFSTWAPTMIVMNYGVFKSLKVGLKMSFRHFGRVFSNAIGMVLTIFIINMSFGLFTFGVGLVVSVPISYLLYNVFGMVVVYEGQGMRYYVDIYNVITPKKKEISDKLKDMRFVV